MKRVLGLDILRATAIVSVVVAHVVSSAVPYSRPTFFLSSVLGFCGVELFFALSGFLIGGILFRDIARTSTFTLQDTVVFWRRRWFRTLPAYLLFLLINAIEARKHSTVPPDLGRYFVFLQNLVPQYPIGPFFQESWSLSVEEWLYLTYPLLLLGLFRLTPRRGIEASIRLSLCLVLGVPLLLRLVFSHDLIWDLQVRKIVVFRLDAIGYGLALAYLAQYRPLRFQQLASRQSLWVSLPLALVGILYFGVNFTRLEIGFHGASAVPMNGLLFVGINAAFTLLVARFSQVNHAPRALAFVAQRLSLYSYSLYLVHTLVIGFLLHGTIAAVLQRHQAGALLFLIFPVALLTLAGLLYHYFELPFTNLRDRFPLPSRN